MKISDRIIIFDTTLRDGEQAPGCHLSPDAKLRAAEQLLRLGVDVIEAGFPVSSPAEFEAVRRIAMTVGRGENAPEIAAFGRCVPDDIAAAWDAIKDARRPRLHVFLATSDIHLEHKLRMTRAQAMRRIVEGVRACAAHTSNVQFSPEDASRSDRTFLAEAVSAAIDAGATTVNITDTVGYAMPDEFSGLIRFLSERVPNIGKAVISVHCHDDLGQAVANSLAAARAGARQIECTLNGIGERAGNCALEEVVMSLRTRADFFRMTTGVSTRELQRTSRLVSELTGMTVQANKAVVGENAFAHASGVHQDGMLKNASTYEIMRPADVGADESRLPLTSRSGRTALDHRLKRLGHTLSTEQLDEAFRKFKRIADDKRYVLDADLQAIVDFPPAAGYTNHVDGIL